MIVFPTETGLTSPLPSEPDGIKSFEVAVTCPDPVSDVIQLSEPVVPTASLLELDIHFTGFACLSESINSSASSATSGLDTP